MLIVQNLTYIHPDKDLLFSNVKLTVHARDKTALVGNNGSGKSTFLKLVAGELQPSRGQLNVDATPYYIPQILGQYNSLTVAAALRIEDKIDALQQIISGKVTEENYALLDNDWTIEERSKSALQYWQLTDLTLSQKMETLSGGQKTRVFLAGLLIHQPELVLLDEPSNHLDLPGRQLLYDFIQSTKSTLIVVSHDRTLLNLLDTVHELSKNGIKVYGGNYDFYSEQKRVENDALIYDIHNKEKALQKEREKEREVAERQQKLDARGKKKHEKAGVARIMMNTLRNNAENSTAKIKSVHAEKIGGISEELQTLRSSVPDIDKMKFDFDHSTLHKGKILCKATSINFAYFDKLLWKENLNIQIVSGERVALKGVNGSGKTTLIQLILGNLLPKQGKIFRGTGNEIYIDQNYSLIDNKLNVYEQAQAFNASGLLEHEIKIRLNRFLFPKDDWGKPCSALSGGERMRLVLCCLVIKNKTPDLIILDEPTNNLDIQNIGILTTAINGYRGTLIVVSHDNSFIEEINLDRTIEL